MNKYKLAAVIVIVAALILVASYSYWGTDDDELQDGFYVSTAEGYGGELEIEVEIKDGEIVGLQVLQHSETERIAGPAFEELFADIKEKQGVAGVELVSGATVTSEAVISAVEKALRIARTELQDGVYVGIAEGYGGELEIEVEIKGGEIIGLQVLQHSETERIAGPAFEELFAGIKEEQGVAGVELVSGATVTSEAVISAVEKALEEAR